MSTVKINNLRKAYGAVEVMSNINVEINDQEFVALVGPSGCGKSTLLRMIAGLEDVSGGEIEIDGTVINDVAPKDRNIAMVFQSYALYPHMTVEENIGFALKLAKVPQDEIKQRVMEAAKTLNLTEYLDRFPRQLSGGQRQRVAMGRSIVRDPAVFLFDEPLSNLDARLRVRMRSEIKSLHKRLNATSIYVTHDQIEAMTMADKIIVLRSGKVEQVGAPLDLYDMPVNTFVASFIGSPSINLLHGTVRHQEQGWVCDITDNVYLPIPANIPVTEGQAIYYGIRPEHIQIDHTGQGIEITVENIEPTGNETYILSSIVGQELLFTSNARMSSNGQEKIHITMNITKVHIFDKATEQRLG